jgi:hypothetical protein
MTSFCRIRSKKRDHTGPAESPQLAADDGRHARAEELDGAHDPVVRHGADAELHQEAVVAEELVLEEDLLRHLLRAADEARAAQRPRGLEGGAGERRPALVRVLRLCDAKASAKG